MPQGPVRFPFDENLGQVLDRRLDTGRDGRGPIGSPLNRGDLGHLPLPSAATLPDA
jgi:hypothetical protein